MVLPSLLCSPAHLCLQWSAGCYGLSNIRHISLSRILCRLHPDPLSIIIYDCPIIRSRETLFCCVVFPSYSVTHFPHSVLRLASSSYGQAITDCIAAFVRVHCSHKHLSKLSLLTVLKRRAENLCACLTAQSKYCPNTSIRVTFRSFLTIIRGIA